MSSSASPPIAFTFGLGAAVLFPLRVGAASILLEQASPVPLLEAIRTMRPTVCFTAPTAYRAMLGMMQPSDVASLRICVSAGEPLPKPTWDAWHSATGIQIMDGIGIHRNAAHLHRRTGGIDQARCNRLAGPWLRGQADRRRRKRLAARQLRAPGVRGPTGCRYLSDARQTQYVQKGWNVTGDTYHQDADGYFWFQARSDDMILSSGYNIAGPEVEAALLTHPAVAECGVVGAPDADRGTIVKAYVVLRDPDAADPTLVRALQEHVKAEIAPYKYPRAIEFVPSLPRGATGKLQRFVLREQAAAVQP